MTRVVETVCIERNSKDKRHKKLTLTPAAVATRRDWHVSQKCLVVTPAGFLPVVSLLGQTSGTFPRGRPSFGPEGTVKSLGHLMVRVILSPHGFWQQVLVGLYV